MKKRLFVLIIMLVSTLISFAQMLDGYKYVFVQTLKYENGTDIWGISSKLSSYFASKGLIVLSETSTPPTDALENPCMVISCFIDHTVVLSGTNKVTITIKNCKNEIIHTNTGSAMGLSLQDDFNKATRRAFNQLNSVIYKFNPLRTPKIEFPEVEQTNETEESIKNYLISNKLDLIEGIYKSYQSDKLSYYKFGIIKKENGFKAIIIESDNNIWKPGEVKAVFDQTSIKGFYSIKWYMGNKIAFETFGNMENEALLSIEFKDLSTGEKRQDKFIKMFPSASNELTIKKEYSKASGSGFFITSGGIIATNAHVVNDASKIEVTVSNEVGNSTYKAKILLIDAKNDVALLKIEDEKFKGMSEIPFGITENSDVGTKVFTIGYPLNDVMGSNFKVTDGIISSKSGIEDDVRYYQISVPLQPGNSGGPLFNKEGNIIGITSARLNGQAIGINIENVNYAIKSSYLLNLYNMLPDANKLSNSSQITTKELNEQVKVLKNFVCLIKVN